MIAKIVKGKTFGGCVRYVLNKDKAELLELGNIHPTDEKQMISDFELQSLLNPKVVNKVGHISLNFAVQDVELESNDALMIKIAKEYMDKMGIQNTQYLIARHTDREHSHCHIVYNRVDNDGKTITDKNDRFRSEKICKMLTAKYRLHFANGKDNVNERRLIGADVSKYHIYNAVNKALPNCGSWDNFELRMKMQGVKMEFKYKSGINERQGVKFEHNGHSFSGSKVDREFSYMRLNNKIEVQSHTFNVSPKHEEQSNNINNAVTEIAGGLLSILSPPLAVGDDDDDQNAKYNRLKSLKNKKKRGFKI